MCASVSEQRSEDNLSLHVSSLLLPRSLRVILQGDRLGNVCLYSQSHFVVPGVFLFKLTEVESHMTLTAKLRGLCPTGKVIFTPPNPHPTIVPIDVLLGGLV